MLYLLRTEKGEQVKKLALLSVAALMFVCSVFTPVAMVQGPGEVTI
jgi:hypothetical protein